VGTRRPINVSGSYYGRGDHFDIVVSNYGLEIHEDEVANLFEKGVRGREVIKHGIGGTGIGLHLAQRIMSEGEGDLLLTSIKDPVSFTIRIPVREKGARA
jgi:signal transduction histidine kinase